MRILGVLLEITVFSAVIYGVTMLLKTILKDRMSPFLHCAVWSLLILRLVIPVTLISPVRLFTLPAPAAAESISTPSVAAPPALPPEQAVPDSALEPSVSQKPVLNMQPVSVGAFADSATPRVAFSLSDCLVAVWLSGAALGLAYLVFLYVRLRRRIQNNAVKPSRRLLALYREVKAELGVKDRVPLVCLWGSGSPGLLFPASVLMPMEALSLMDEAEIKNVLAHELTHFQRGDQAVCILLSVLNAVYWFNPIVYLAVRQIRLDMETACDSRVVRRMTAEEKGSYARLILALFSRPRCGEVVLGMAHGKKKSIAEQRIRGVFMNRNTKPLARALCALSAILMLAGCFTTACVPQRADSAPAAASGNAGISIEPLSPAADITPAPSPTPAPAPASPLAAVLGAPEHWSYEGRSADGLLLLRGNLDLTLPNVSQMPMAKAVCREVTEEDLLNAASSFFGPDVKFVTAPEDTKEYFEKLIEKDRELYEKVKAGTNENMIPSYVKSVIGQYEYRLEAVKSAPSAAEKRPVEPVMVERVGVSGDPYKSFRGVAVKDGVDYLVSAANTDHASAVNIAEVDGDFTRRYFGTHRREPVDLAITREQAVELSSAFAARIDPGLSLSHVMTVGQFMNDGDPEPAHPWAWRCVFMRSVNGVGTVYDSRDVGSDIDSNIVGRVNEALELTVDDRGICSVRWINPLTVTEVTDENVTLRPFSSIVENLPDQARQMYDYDVTRTEGNRADTLYIRRAELGLMRVGKLNSPDYTLEPVWSFFIGFEEQPDLLNDPDYLKAAYDGDPDSWNSLTVSAVNGRVLDRDLGM